MDLQIAAMIVDTPEAYSADEIDEAILLRESHAVKL